MDRYFNPTITLWCSVSHRHLDVPPYCSGLTSPLRSSPPYRKTPTCACRECLRPGLPARCSFSLLPVAWSCRALANFAHDFTRRPLVPLLSEWWRQHGQPQEKSLRSRQDHRCYFSPFHVLALSLPLPQQRAYNLRAFHRDACSFPLNSLFYSIPRPFMSGRPSYSVPRAAGTALPPLPLVPLPHLSRGRTSAARAFAFFESRSFPRRQLSVRYYGSSYSLGYG